MRQVKKQKMNRLGLAIFTCLLLILSAGCAKLPLDNGAPAAPQLASDGVLEYYGVEIIVTVDDPDGDMVTLAFQATNPSGVMQDFAPTNFIASGRQESFILNLNAVGLWTLTARATDELAEVSPAASIEVLVSLP